MKPRWHRYGSALGGGVGIAVEAGLVPDACTDSDPEEEERLRGEDE